MSRFHWLEINNTKKKITSVKAQDYDAQFYLIRAREKFLSGEFEPALRYYSRALEQEHLLEEAWIGQVRCLVELGEFSEAVVWSDRALQLFPGNAQLLATKALALGRKGEIDRALAASDLSLKAASEKDGLVWWVRGDILIANNFSVAEVCFRKALELNQDKFELKLAIAKTYLSVAKFEEAKKILLSAQREGESNPQFWYFLGFCFERLGELEKAKSFYQRALTIKPEYREASSALRRLEQKGFLSRAFLWLKNFF